MDTWTFGDARYPCPIALTLDRLAGKWKTNLLWHVYDGTTRFNALCRALPHVNRGVVLRQLRSMERDGLLQREVREEGNVRHVEYLLTERTESLIPAIVELARWGNRYGEKESG